MTSDQEAQNTLGFSIVLLVLCAICLVIQFVTSQIEKKFEISSPHIVNCLTRIYKGVLICCICSLLLYIEEREGFFIKDVGARDAIYSSLQYTIFTAMALFCGCFIYLLLMVRWWSLSFRKYQLEGLHTFAQGGIEGGGGENRRDFDGHHIPRPKQSFLSNCKIFCSRDVADLFLNWLRGPSKRKFDALKMEFIVPLNLPETFNFGLYCVVCVRNFVCDLALIHTGTFLMLLVLCAIMIVVRSVAGDWDHIFSEQLGSSSFLILGYTILVISLILTWKVTKILREMAYNSKMCGFSDAYELNSRNVSNMNESLLAGEGHVSTRPRARTRLVSATDRPAPLPSLSGAMKQWISQQIPCFDSGLSVEYQLFWFKSPKFASRLLQVVFLLCIVYVALMLTTIRVQSGLFWILAIVPPLLMFFSIPRCIVTLGLASGMGRLSQPAMLHDVTGGRAGTLDFL